MARVLVTGSSGFIGKHLVLTLQDNQHDVIQVNRSEGDVADGATWSKLPRADVVIHLAGRAFVPDSWRDPAGYIKTNLCGTVCALDYCRTHNARLVFLSSYLYGQPERLPIAESARLQVNNPYALSKKLAEEACEFYSSAFAVRVSILRPFNVYGPNQGQDFLIPSIIKQSTCEATIRVKDLEPKRDFIYIDDLADAITKAAELDQLFDIFNIGTGVSFSVAEVIRFIQEINGTNFEVQSDNERRPSEIMDTQADITKAVNILGWCPRWALKSGLRNMLKPSNAR